MLSVPRLVTCISRNFGSLAFSQLFMPVTPDRRSPLKHTMGNGEVGGGRTGVGKVTSKMWLSPGCLRELVGQVLRKERGGPREGARGKFQRVGRADRESGRLEWGHQRERQGQIPAGWGGSKDHSGLGVSL